jgi:hypothetical protein
VGWKWLNVYGNVLIWRHDLKTGRRFVYYTPRKDQFDGWLFNGGVLNCTHFTVVGLSCSSTPGSRNGMRKDILIDFLKIYSSI